MIKTKTHAKMSRDQVKQKQKQTKKNKQKRIPSRQEKRWQLCVWLYKFICPPFEIERQGRRQWKTQLKTEV